VEGIQPSDADLVRRALGATTDQDRTAAFEAIADKYRLTVLRQCAFWYPDPEAAQDVGQAAFEAAFKLLVQGKGPERPDKLAGWLIEIARHRGQEYIRKTKPVGVQWADLPEGRRLEETADDEEDHSGSAARRAHATKLVERVVATLTVQQQQVYRLRFVEELTGREIAARLGIADKAASNEATIVQGLIADGFGALILMQEGRRYCADLARILDEAGRTHPITVGTFASTPASTAVFTEALRKRIVKHFNDCDVCDKCRTCNSKRRQLVGPYAPALIPILFAGEFRDRIDDVIRRVVEQAHASHNPPGHPGFSPPAAAGIVGSATLTSLVVGGSGDAAQGAASMAIPPPPGGPSTLNIQRFVRRGRKVLTAGHGAGGAALVVAVAALATGVALAVGGSAHQAGSQQAANTSLADHQTWCGSAFIADDLLNVYIIRGSETCSSTVQSIFNSYGNKLLENPGSSGNFTIDDWSCSHANVPESQATGVWAVCTQGGAMMETIGGPTH
jgi:RNA polymerase sigma factor (sigma-70 family)